MSLGADLAEPNERFGRLPGERPLSLVAWARRSSAAWMPRGLRSRIMNGPVSKLHAVRPRRTLVVVFCLGYVALAGGYLLLVAHESGVWQTKRQKRIEESPVVWVAPYGIHYHRESHYGRHLSSPLTLYEATERGYERCNICDPLLPAQLLQSPFGSGTGLVILVALSCSWLVTLVVFHKSGGGFISG